MDDGVELVYLEHLTDNDRALLADAAGTARVRAAQVPRLLSDVRTHRAVFGPAGDGEPLLRASPFLTFAVAVHRSAEELRTTSFTEEWVGPRQRVPVFDVDVLRDFLDDPWRRLLLVELLASYTHVASGSTWVRTPRGWRRRRFSELDPVRLSSLLEVVSEAERPGVLRRLGDLALFLTGVFPDHTAAQGLPPIGQARLLRSGGLAGDAEPAGDLPSAVARLGTVGVLEHLGARWYRAAAAAAPAATGTMRAVAQVGERFSTARRVLNLVTERQLFPYRARWFGLGPPST